MVSVNFFIRVVLQSSFLVTVWAQDNEDSKSSNEGKNEYPWLVRLQSESIKDVCVGVLIEENLILTAANCVQNVGKLTISAGVSPSELQTKTIEMSDADAVKIHGNYSVSGQGVPLNDVALIRVHPPFIMTTTVNVAVLASPLLKITKTSCFAIRPNVVVSSASGNTDTHIPPHVQFGLNITDSKNCAVLTNSSSIITEEMVCTVGAEKDTSHTCAGDRGGPLICLDLGVPHVSGIRMDVNCTQPAIFTRVSSSSQWIKDAFKEYKTVTNPHTDSEYKTGTNPPTDSIGDSEPAQLDYPWIVQLNFSSSDNISKTCNGIVINDTLILTPAHCAKNGSIVEITVPAYTQDIMGRVSFKQNQTDAQIIVHENYMVSSDDVPLNDIALIKLKQPLNSSIISPIKLSTHKTDGFLEVVNNGTHGPEVIPVVVDSNTAKVNISDEAKVIFVHNRSPDDSACFISIGNPLITRLGNTVYLIGIQSSEATCSLQRIFLNISHYSDWIRTNSASDTISSLPHFAFPLLIFLVISN